MGLYVLGRDRGTFGVLRGGSLGRRRGSLRGDLRVLGCLRLGLRRGGGGAGMV